MSFDGISFTSVADFADSETDHLAVRCSRNRETAMLRGNCVLDLVEELRVRQWARRNWVPLNLRDQRWHHVILDEMTQRDRELDDSAASANAIVPLAEPTLRLPGPHYLQPQFTHADRVTSDADSSAQLHFG